ncbi:DUF58 domain-containing protein [Thalassomonas viridans]|uniref:DUF58 domain-containing protein n=1 Tax=Thalassomonas viridans TaxID=137584 RepID=A0AAE9Z6L9_9GAMM|nr:DUF58 domain-containing protein [Thalassomonas viridans]WDE07746.1 DUF58 domain-containing protein [Thalassomonas viridans]
MFGAGTLLKVKSAVKRRFSLWLQQRLPAEKYQLLHRGNIFILPSRFGCAYLLLVLLIFLLGTNYQNNVIILMSYLMGSLFITVMLQSFFNLSGLALSCHGQCSGYAGQGLSMPVTLLSKIPRYDVSLSFAGQQPVHIGVVRAEQMSLNLPFFSKVRGVIDPGRITVKSEYSLGLFVCWTRLDFGCSCIVYPQAKLPGGSLLYFSKSGGDKENTGKTSTGAEDFYELKAYVPGEPFNRVAWKQFARGQGKYTKHYRQQQGDVLWLTLADMPGPDTETKLQYLCCLLLHYQNENYQYGLELGGQEFQAGSGDFHLKTCLRALAAYPQSQAREH